MIKKFVILLMLAASVSPVGRCVTNESFTNPVIWADVPDPDVIRVGDNYYMVSTTMHLMPGCPVMRSKDLVNWETIGYVFDRLTDTPRYDLEGGTVYGKGQWATSIQPPTLQGNGSLFVARTISMMHRCCLTTMARYMYIIMVVKSASGS